MGSASPVGARGQRAWALFVLLGNIPLHQCAEGGVTGLAQARAAAGPSINVSVSNFTALQNSLALEEVYTIAITNLVEIEEPLNIGPHKRFTSRSENIAEAECKWDPRYVIKSMSLNTLFFWEGYNQGNTGSGTEGSSSTGDSASAGAAFATGADAADAVYIANATTIRNATANATLANATTIRAASSTLVFHNVVGQFAMELPLEGFIRDTNRIGSEVESQSQLTWKLDESAVLSDCGGLPVHLLMEFIQDYIHPLDPDKPSDWRINPDGTVVGHNIVSPVVGLIERLVYLHVPSHFTLSCVMGSEWPIEEMTVSAHCYRPRKRYHKYLGNLNVTRSGKPCKRWDSMERGAQYTSYWYPDDGLQGSECRQPDRLMPFGGPPRDSPPWCYVEEGPWEGCTDEAKCSTAAWEECDVPACSSSCLHRDWLATSLRRRAEESLVSQSLEGEEGEEAKGGAEDEDSTEEDSGLSNDRSPTLVFMALLTVACFLMFVFSSLILRGYWQKSSVKMDQAKEQESEQQLAQEEEAAESPVRVGVAEEAGNEWADRPQVGAAADDGPSVRQSAALADAALEDAEAARGNPEGEAAPQELGAREGQRTELEYSDFNPAVSLARREYAGEGCIPVGASADPAALLSAAPCHIQQVVGDAAGLQVKEVIAQGRMGKLYRAHREDGEAVVLRVLELVAPPATAPTLIREIDALPTLAHTNILRTLACSITRAKPCKVLFKSGVEELVHLQAVVQQEMAAVDVAAALHLPYFHDLSSSCGVHLPHVLQVLLDVSAAMVYLHSRNMVHGDIKAQNVFCFWHRTRNSAAPEMVAKIGNVGLSKVRRLAAEARAATGKGRGQAGALPLVGTITHEAPEALRQPGHTSMLADVFAFGVLMWQMVTRDQPFRDLTPSEVVQHVAVEDRRLAWPKDCCPRWYIELVQQCWDRSPTDRPSFTSVAHALKQLQRLHARTAPATVSSVAE